MRAVIETLRDLALLLIVYAGLHALVWFVVETWPALVAGSAVGWAGLSLHTYWSE